MRPAFSKSELLQMLGALNEELRNRGITGEICVIGGAAMVLGFASRQSTRDIDALVIAPAEIRGAIQSVAELHGWPKDWLNDGAKGFASGAGTELNEILAWSHLRVVAPSPEYILAMKCIAARTGVDDHDKEDSAFLMGHLKLAGPEEAMRIVEKFYPAARIPAKTSYFIQEVFDEYFPTSPKHS